MDGMGFANPTRPQPPDSILKIDLGGYQIMRLVVGAVFRTIPTPIPLTYIAVKGNNPNDGTYLMPPS
jgi:hypothetical protein